MSNDRIIVIGGGLAGLAAANTLAARGHAVTLLEANDWLGGKAAVLEQDGFRFDMGPTILTMPKVLQRVFSEAGRSMHDYLDLRKLDPQWRCFFDDGSVLDLVEDIDTMAAAIESYSDADDAKGFREFIGVAEQLHAISDRFFFWKSVEDMKDTFNASNSFKLSTLKDVMALRMGRSVAQTIRSHVDDHRVAQLLDHFVQYVGSSPFGSPAVLCSIAHMQVAEGVWYPIGGTRAVPEALIKLAEEQGVELRTGCEVSRVLVENGTAKGVKTADGEVIRGAAVVSNMDSVRTMRELVGGAPAQRFLKRRKHEPACSGVVLYLGLEEAYEQVAHHNFVFSASAEIEFEHIYGRGVPAPDPTCYLAAPGRTETGVAPDGGEALYVLVHTPYLRPEHDWQKMFPEYRQVILDKLKRCAGMNDIEDRIVTESALTPQDIHERYRVLDGAIYGLASHGLFNGAFKPGNRSRDVQNLYLAGGAAHPGPGMPMVLMSGWIAGDTLDQDARSAGWTEASKAAEAVEAEVH
ncbi:MAG: phytoene desaturase family protein [Xanthomonadales bacterium]|nr:phytoene desaturase family protein [Xanthomonadales bacterium]